MKAFRSEPQSLDQYTTNTSLTSEPFKLNWCFFTLPEEFNIRQIAKLGIFYFPSVSGFLEFCIHFKVLPCWPFAKKVVRHSAFEIKSNVQAAFFAPINVACCHLHIQLGSLHLKITVPIFVLQSIKVAVPPEFTAIMFLCSSFLRSHWLTALWNHLFYTFSTKERSN